MIFGAVAAVLIAGREANPPWVLQAASALDTFAISLALVATGDPQRLRVLSTCGWGCTRLVLPAASRSHSTGPGSHRLRWSLALLDGAPAARLTQWLLPVMTLMATGTLVWLLMNRLRAARCACGMRPGTTRSPGWRTAPCSPPDSRRRSLRRMATCVRRVRRPRSLQARQRQPRAPCRRCAARRGGRAASRACGPVGIAGAFRRRRVRGAAARARLGGDQRAPAARVRATVQRGRLRACRHRKLRRAAARRGDDPQALVRRADAAVYKAKHSGGAQLATFDEVPPRVQRSDHPRLNTTCLARWPGRDRGSPTSRSFRWPTARCRRRAARALDPFRFGPVAPEMFVGRGREKRADRSAR